MSANPSIELSETVLRAVRGHHAFEGCVEQLGTAIRLGVYPRGTTLPPERELAERMGVSRATLREAIAALRAADFVQTTRGRGGGTVVSYRPKKPSARGARALGPRSDALRDMLVFRRVVEPGACHIAAGRDLAASAAGPAGGRARRRRRAPPTPPSTGRPTPASTSRSPRSPTPRSRSGRSPRCSPTCTTCSAPSRCST